MLITELLYDYCTIFFHYTIDLFRYEANQRIYWFYFNVSFFFLLYVNSLSTTNLALIENRLYALLFRIFCFFFFNKKNHFFDFPCSVFINQKKPEKMFYKFTSFLILNIFYIVFLLKILLHFWISVSLLYVVYLVSIETVFYLWNNFLNN